MTWLTDCLGCQLSVSRVNRVESVTICLHVSIALAVFDNGTDRKTVKRRDERTEDNRWVNRHVCPFL